MHNLLDLLSPLVALTRSSNSCCLRAEPLNVVGGLVAKAKLIHSMTSGKRKVAPDWQASNGDRAEVSALTVPLADESCGGQCGESAPGSACSGSQCQAPVCTDATCNGHGTCQPTTGSCDCAPGYPGLACDGCATGLVGFP